MSHYQDILYPQYQMDVEDVFVTSWEDVPTLWGPADAPRPALSTYTPMLFPGPIPHVNSTLVAEGWTDLPYANDHRAYLIRAQLQEFGRSKVLWSRRPYADELSFGAQLADERLWAPMPSWYESEPAAGADGVADPVDGAAIRYSMIWLYLRQQAAYQDDLVITRQEYATFGFRGNTWSVARWEITLDAVVIASVIALDQQNIPDPLVWIEPEDRPAMTGVGIVELESDDLKQLANAIERLMEQKITLNVNNGRVVVQWPSGEVVQESQS